MANKGLQEMSIDEILERIKEQSPDSVVSCKLCTFFLVNNYILTRVVRRSLLRMYSLLRGYDKATNNDRSSKNSSYMTSQ